MPSRLSLKSLRQAAAACRGCDLYKYATQTVFGEGPARARLMLVGEEPGDSEDLEGHPFVGPAGKLLHRAMETAGIAARDVYVTNAVKHFKFVERGKRRIHQKAEGRRDSRLSAVAPERDRGRKATVDRRFGCDGGAVAPRLHLSADGQPRPDRSRTTPDSADDSPVSHPPGARS